MFSLKRKVKKYSKNTGVFAISSKGIIRYEAYKRGDSNIM